MGLGRGFTAVARQVPRLAGFMKPFVRWLTQAAIGRQALRLAWKNGTERRTDFAFSYG